MRELFLYSKKNCHLCDTMLLELKALLAGSDSRYHVIKIDGDSELEQRYGARVPVLVGGERELCQLYLDTATVRDFLDEGR